MLTNVFVGLVLVVVFHKRCSSKEELESDDADCPPVHAFSATLWVESGHLRRYVLCCTNECSTKLTWLEHSCQAKVYQLDVTSVTANHNVVWLQVSVHDALAMKVANAKDYLVDDKLDILLFKLPLKLFQIPSMDEWHDEEDVHGGLEAVVHTTEQRVFKLKQDCLLKQRVLYGVQLYQFVLAHLLDSILLT